MKSPPWLGRTSANPGAFARLIHHTHTDVGFTSAPSVARDQQKRYIDAAIDLCTSEKDFRWTVESILNLDDWWQVASRAQHTRLLTLIDTGRMDVMGLPLNQVPLLNALQWRQMMSWIPDDRVKPRAAMQRERIAKPTDLADGSLRTAPQTLKCRLALLPPAQLPGASIHQRGEVFLCQESALSPK